MSSIVTEVLGVGRQSIGLTGEFEGKTKTISIDITSAFTVTANADITEHGIEKDAKNPIPTITDHVRPKLPTLSLEIILADDLVEGIKAKEKMKVISFWQKTGSLIRLDGYGTGSNIPGLRQALDSFRSEMKDTTPYDAFNVGIDTDTIPSLVLGNISWKKSTDTGPNIGASMSMQRVYLATSRIGMANSGKPATGNNTGVKNAGKTDPKTAANQNPTPKPKSILSGATG